MSKVLYIAAREFVSTVMTRGFLIGWLLTPLIMSLLLFSLPRLLGQRGFRAQGDIAVIDRSGALLPALREAVDPHHLAERRAADARRILSNAPGMSGPGRVPEAGNELALSGLLGEIPDLQVLERPVDADLAHERAWLYESAAGARRHLALIVVDREALAYQSTARAASAYDLYLPVNLDGRIENVVRQVVRNAIVAARAHAAGIDPGEIDRLVAVEEGRPIIVARDGSQRPSTGVFNRLLPFGFLLFMLMGVLGGGQFLLTTMVEEKSSRIIEVLLSAVSPLQLLAGKILGQLGASMVGMGLYVLVALIALLAFALFGLIDPWLLLYALLFFMLSFLVVGSIMVAIGASVEQMRDAQSLLTPVVLALSSIGIFAGPILLNPNSRLSTVLSFTPLINGFAMIIRMASSAPPPLWQVWLSVAVSVASVFATIWFASKVFRVALLLHGRPPNLGTLLRWAFSS
jgi:ABC-2 type transport system permease protein